MTLAKVEEAYRAETETKETMEEVIEFASLYQLKDYMNATDDGADENRLLPAINKIWPFFLACIRNRNPVVQSLSIWKSLCGVRLFIEDFCLDGRLDRFFKRLHQFFKQIVSDLICPT